jgi:cytochrome b561
MPLRNDAERWGGLSIALHWLTFLLVLGMATVGLLMVQMEPSPLKVQVYALHKSFGLTVLGLTVLRLLWRASGRVPAPVPGTPAWQQRIASATHGALYALLLAVPLSGWWFNSAAGFPLRWFGLVKLPKLTGFDPAKLADSRFDVAIDVASADTRNQERDEMLRSAEFFGAKKTPQARFLAQRFRALGGNRYAADGVLSLHGISKPVALSFCWSGGATPVLAGEARLKRLDFNVGTGDWADTSELPNEVRVKTRLLLAPAPKK